MRSRALALPLCSMQWPDAATGVSLPHIPLKCQPRYSAFWAPLSSLVRKGIKCFVKWQSLVVREIANR
eukprot:scaffold55_cov181-Alexandrium_tamarense.AAC.9